MTTLQNGAKKETAVAREITRALRMLLRRLRVVILLRGILAVVAVLVISLLAVMAADASLTPIAAWSRWTLTGGALVAILAAAGWFLVRPLAKTFTLGGVARMLEARHPEMQERISSALELLTSTDSADLRGSQALIAALARQAGRDVQGIRPRREFTHRRSRPHLAAACIAGAVLGVILAAWPGQSVRLLTRAVAPFANLPNIQASELVISPSTDTTVMEGQPLSLSVWAPADGNRLAEVRTSIGDGSERATEMALVQGPATEARAATKKHFGFAFTNVTESFRYRIRLGDAVTRYYNVTVIPKPTIEWFKMTYEYPAYTGLTPQVTEGRSGDISALAGTVVHVEVFSPTDTSSADVRCGADEQIAKVVTSRSGGKTKCAFSLPVRPKPQGRWSIQLLRNEAGKQFAGDLSQYAMDVLADARPSGQIALGQSEAASFVLNRKDTPTVYCRASDDFGISRVELLVEIDGRALPPAAIDVKGDADSLSYLGSTVLDLPKLDVATANTVRLQVHVLDNRSDDLGGPQEGYSQVVEIKFDDDASYLHVQLRLDDELSIRQTLEDVLKNVKSAKADSHELRTSLARGGSLQADDIGRVDRMRKQLAPAHRMLEELRADIGGGVYAGLSERIAETSDHVELANRLSGEIKITDEATVRGNMSDEADFEVGRAVAIISEMLNQFGVLTDMVRKAELLTGLSEEQELLAELARSGGVTPPGEIDVSKLTYEEWGKAQKLIAGELGQIVAKSPEALDLMAERDKERSKSLTARAASLAREQDRVLTHTVAVGELDKILAKLAARQQALAKTTTAAKLDEQAAGAMTQAAASIKAEKLTEAIDAQNQALSNLKITSGLLARQIVASEMARKAAAVAAGQKKLASEASKAAKATAQSAAQADKAAKARQEALKIISQEKIRLTDTLSKLAARQDKLAELSQSLASKTASVQAADSAKDVKPAEAMKQTADSIRKAEFDKATQQAATATTQADQLTAKLREAARTPQTSELLDSAISSARKEAAEAQKAADETATAAEKALAKAAEAVKSGDKDAADKARAEALARKAEADTASAKASETRKTLDDLVGRRSHEQAADSKAVGDLARESEQIASQQKKLSSEISAIGKGQGAKLTSAQASLKVADNSQAKAKTQAAAAAKRLQEMAARQKQLSAQARVVEEMAPKATAAASKATAQHKLQDDMNAAEHAMTAAKASEASAAANQATQKAEALARKLAEHDQLPAELAKQSKSVQSASEEQTALRQETRAALAQRYKLVRGQVHRLQKKQAALAEEAANLATTVAKVAPQTDRLQTTAAQAGADTSEALDERNPSRAVAKAQMAAQQLDELAMRLGDARDKTGETQNDSASPSALDAPDAADRRELAADARRLANRQKHLAEQIRGVANRNPRALAKALQDEITDMAADVASDTDLLREHAQDLGLDKTAGKLATEAAQAAASGRQHSAKASAELKGAKAASATAPQQETATAMKTTAARLAALGKHLQKLAGRAPELGDDIDPEELADAYESTAEAAAEGAATDAERAAELLAGLAKAAIEMAQSLGADMGMAMMNASSVSLSATGDSRTAAGPKWISRARLNVSRFGITDDQWARLPGELRDEILQAAAAEGPPEYQQYIKDYFREVARRAAAIKPPPTGEAK